MINAHPFQMSIHDDDHGDRTDVRARPTTDGVADGVESVGRNGSSLLQLSCISRGILRRCGQSLRAAAASIARRGLRRVVRVNGAAPPIASCQVASGLMSWHRSRVCPRFCCLRSSSCLLMLAASRSTLSSIGFSHLGHRRSAAGVSRVVLGSRGMCAVGKRGGLWGDPHRRGEWSQRERRRVFHWEVPTLRDRSSKSWAFLNVDCRLLERTPMFARSGPVPVKFARFWPKPCRIWPKWGRHR